MASKIDTYFIEINITTTKFYIFQTPLSEDIAIQRTNQKKVKKVTKQDG